MDYWKFMQHGLFGKGSARKLRLHGK